jgi:hypothetical protein
MRLSTVTALVIALLLAVPFAEASAPSTEEARWRAYSRAMAAPWPDIQRNKGNLPDYLDGLNNEFRGTRYGDSWMGWGMLQTGVREGDGRLVASGLKAIRWATSPARRWPQRSEFEAMALASAYNFARRHLARDPRFKRIRRQWARWLKRFRFGPVRDSSRFGNHRLVDALVVLEFQRTGLRSRRRGTVLGPGRVAARRRAIRLINVRVPRLARGDGPFVLSDPPDLPVSYHGLSTAFYARAMRLMGRRAGPSARRALRRMVRASRLMAAPDGDVSYFGRSQAGIWTLPATAYAAQRAALIPGTSSELAAESDALAERTLERLRREYGIGRRGSWVTPALAQDLRAGARGVDGYAGAPAYSGLALVWLNLTIQEHPRDPRPGRLPADNLLSATVSRGAGRFAVVRRSDHWYAIKMTRSPVARLTDDLRYDFGLVTLKRRLGEDRWTDLVPQRPRTDTDRHETAGPTLVNGRGLPFGERITATSDGAVRIGGGFRTASGRVLRRLVFTYEPAACGGVRLSFPARARDAFALGAFFRGGPPRVAGATATAGGQQVTVDPTPVFGRPADGGASGTHARLTRLPIVVRVPADRRVSVTYCEPADVAFPDGP